MDASKPEPHHVRARSSVALPRINLHSTTREDFDEDAEPIERRAGIVGDIRYPLLAPPHSNFEPVVHRYFQERKNFELFGKRLHLSLERLQFTLAVTVATLVCCVFPAVPEVQALVTADYAPFIPVVPGLHVFLHLIRCLAFVFVMAQKTLDETIVVGGYSMFGAGIGCLFSLAVGSFMHNKWAILGLYCAFSLVILVIDSLQDHNPQRLAVVKIALHSSAIAILFNANLTCATCQFPLRVLRVFSLYAVSFVATLLSYALFSPNGSQWNLPEQIALLLEGILEHVTLMHRRVSHDYSLCSWHHSLQEADYEALLTVRSTMSNEAKIMTSVAADNSARLQYIKALLKDAHKQRFADRVLLDFLDHLIQTIALALDAAMGMRLALLTEFPGKLDAHFLHRLYEIHTPSLDLLRSVVSTANGLLRKAHYHHVWPVERLADRRTEVARHFQGLIRRYMLAHGEQFPAEVSRMNLFVMCCDALSAKMQDMVDADWELYASRKRSLFRHRVRLFFHSILAPGIDLANFLLSFVLGIWSICCTVCRWLFIDHTSGPLILATAWLSSVWDYLISDRWHFAIRLTFAIASASALLIGISSYVSFNTHAIWVVLTIILVMLPTVGGTVTRSLHRLVGTIFAGAVGYISASIAYAVGGIVGRVLLAFGFTAVVATFCAYSWAHSRAPYSWQVTIITYLLIVFSTQSESTALRYAGERVLSIAAGIIWAAITTALIFPKYARVQLVAACHEAIHAFHKAFDRMLRLTVGLRKRDKQAMKKGQRPSDESSRPPSGRAASAENCSSRAEIAIEIAPAEKIGESTKSTSSRLETPRENGAPPTPRLTIEDESGRRGSIEVHEDKAEREAASAKKKRRPKHDESPAEAFREILATLEQTVSLEVALLVDVQLERWSPPKRDIPAILQPFFRRTLRYLQISSLLLQTPIPPLIYPFIADLKTAGHDLHHSIKRSQAHLLEALLAQNYIPSSDPDFIPPASACRVFDERLAARLRRLERSFYDEWLPDFVRLTALWVLQKELVREWDQVVFTVLLQDVGSMMVKDVKGGYQQVEKDPFGTIVYKGVEGVIGVAKTTVGLLDRWRTSRDFSGHAPSASEPRVQFSVSAS